MLELLTDQRASDRLFGRWKKAMIGGSTSTGSGWVIDGTGISFTNYGWGRPGTIENEVMLGADTEAGTGTVKIVQPDVEGRDKGKLTAIARDEKDRHFLLRQGRLQKNRLSRSIIGDFSLLTGLQPTPVNVGGKRSARAWYVVAGLGETPQKIVEATTEFTLACATARLKAGGGAYPAAEQTGYSLGLDEQGRIVKVNRTGSSGEVIMLQGYVWEALQQLVGHELIKPTQNGFSVDGVLKSAKLLIEIKTAIGAHNIYEAVGQLKLYPSLVGLESGLRPTLLVPDKPMLKVAMAAALHATSISVYTYSVGEIGKKPRIIFCKQFRRLCGLTV